jgi:Tfp pilus assembly protein PilF
MISALRTLSVVTLVVVFTACGGGSSEDRIARANEFLAASDDDSAIIELKNALQQESDSAEARWLLGKVYWKPRWSSIRNSSRPIFCW